MSFSGQSPNLPVLADQLLPFLLPLLRQQTQAGASASVGQHELSGGLHVGVLADSQAPQFLKMDGSRALTGSLAVDAGVLIDGVDLSEHAGDAAAHHAPVTAGTLISVLGQQVGIAGGNQQYQVPVTGAIPFAPAWTALENFAGNGMIWNAGAFNIAVSGLGLGVGVNAVTLTSSSAPTGASILASDANGYLQLVRLTTTERLRSPLIDTASGNLTVSPAADLMLSPVSNLVKLASGKALQSDGYASQSTGMRITHAGEGDFRYLFVDEMHAKSFIADLEQALAGGQIISKSVAVLASTFTAPAAGATATLVVRDLPSAPDMACFVSGDIVRLRQFSRASGSLTIADCWGVVTAYVDNTDGTQSWTFTRSSAPNAGAMSAGATVAADALALDYGTTGNGFYEVNAVDGAYALNSPYAQIVSWATHPATGQTVRSRLGNLRGIFGAANEYGLFAGAGTAVSDAYLRISNTEVGLYNLPLRMYTGGTERVHIAAHNDVWIGPSSADKRLSWDGSTLTVSGAINVLGGNAATLDNVTGAINLVANASFEADTNGDGLADGFAIYNNDGGAVPTVASQVAGERSTWAQRISWTGTNATTKGIRFNSVVTKRANVDYVLTFWARTNTPVNLAFYENSPPATQTALIWPQANTTWQFYARRLRWSSTPAANFYISISVGAAIANGWIEFDNVMVVENSEIVPWSLAPSDKANTSLDNSVLSTLINGANIRVGSGTKDSTLNGWNIDSGEIVGQAAGVDQVVLNTSGQILAGAGNIKLSIDGLTAKSSHGVNSTSSTYPIGWTYTYPGSEVLFQDAPDLFDYGLDAVFYPGGKIGDLRSESLHVVPVMFPQSWWTTHFLKLEMPVTLPKPPAVPGYSQSTLIAGIKLIAGNNTLTIPHSSSFTTQLPLWNNYPLALLSGTNTWTQNNYFNANVGIGTASPAALCDVNGRILAVTVGYDWSELTPQNNWSNYGGPNATFGVKRFGNMVSVKGLVSAGAAISANTAINSRLAAEYRPSAGRSFACMGSIGGAKAVVRVYVDSSGYIRPQDGFSSGDWLSVEFTYFTGG